MTASPRETEPLPVPVPGFEVRRWRRFGHDRLYVSVAEGGVDRQLGFRDLGTLLDHPVDPVDRRLLGAVADQWSQQQRPSPPSAPVVLPAGPPADLLPTTPPPAPPRPWRDLSLNEAGRSAQSVAASERARAPVRSFLGRALDLHTPERSWRLGAKGERLVGKQLDTLRRRDPGWTVLHAVPVGNRGADIDHLLIGPGGVFTLNTKHHPDADIWVGGDTFMVNGSRTTYVKSSRHEAARATRLLSDAVGRPVPVTGVIVPVGCRSPLTVKSHPRDVHVVARRDLVEWASALGPIWPAPDLARIWDHARRSTTWT